MTEDREIQLRLVFTNYEINLMDQFLNSHVQKMKRHNPHLHFDIPTLRKDLPLLRFNPNLNPKILAFELFVFQVELIQAFQPHTSVFYTGVLKDIKNSFQNLTL